MQLNCTRVSKLIDLFIGQIKYYLEGSGKDKGKVAELLPRVVAELGKEWMEAAKNGLGMP